MLEGNLSFKELLEFLLLFCVYINNENKPSLFYFTKLNRVKMSFKPLQNQSYNNFNNLSKFVGFFILLPFFLFIISCDSNILINDQKNNNTQLSIIGEDAETISKFPNYLVAITSQKNNTWCT